MSVCGREKCAWKRKPYPPGVHGKSFRRGLSEFGQQLQVKQRLKFLYGLRERQFKNYVSKAVFQKRAPTGDALVTSLELRLDNVVYRLGFLPTRASARQAVTHGHIAVNGKRVTIPSYKLKIGDLVAVPLSALNKKLFTNLAITIKKYAQPEWLELDKSNFSGKITALPPIQDLVGSYNISSIVEYYSR